MPLPFEVRREKQTGGRILLGKKYKVIYADPPWHFQSYSKKGEGRSAENHYHTKDIEEIQSLQVAGIADDDCILFCG